VHNNVQNNPVGVLNGQGILNSVSGAPSTTADSVRRHTCPHSEYVSTLCSFCSHSSCFERLFRGYAHRFFTTQTSWVQQLSDRSGGRLFLNNKSKSTSPSSPAPIGDEVDSSVMSAASHFEEVCSLIQFKTEAPTLSLVRDSRLTPRGCARSRRSTFPFEFKVERRARRSSAAPCTGQIRAAVLQRLASSSACGPTRSNDAIGGAIPNGQATEQLDRSRRPFEVHSQFLQFCR